MSNHGYQVGVFRLTPHYKPDDAIEFDSGDFGPGGAIAYITGIFDKMIADQGSADKHSSRYLQIVGYSVEDWRIVMQVKSGMYGETRELINVSTHEKTGDVNEDDAIVASSFVVLVVPSEGNQGLLIAQSAGGKTAIAALLTALKPRLKIANNMAIRFTSDVVDAQAWKELLDDDDTRIAEVELQTGKASVDGTPFAKRGVAKASLSIGIEKGSGAEKRLKKEIKKSIAKGKNTGVLEVLGIKKLKDDDFGSAAAVTVRDGVQRKIRVEQEPPKFIYVTGDAELDLPEFLDAIESVVDGTLESLKVDRPINWWQPKSGLEV